MPPYNTRNTLWISEIFQCSIRRFDGSLRAKTFPIFIVQGSTRLKVEDRSINFQLFDHLNQEGYSFGLIHIMDENYDHDISVYYLDKCIVIFREYFRPNGGKIHLLKDYSKSFFLPNYHNTSYSGLKYLVRIYRDFAGKRDSVFQFMKRQYLPSLPSTDKTFYIPLGYTDRVGRLLEHQASTKSHNHNQKITERKYKWSFCGQSLKRDRELMLRYLKNCQPNFVYRSDGAGHSEMLSGEDYWKIMTQSIFIPCPLGNINTDTYRLFEALESGAIPIILKSYASQPYDYYKNLLGDHPIPTFLHWKEVEIFLETINVSSVQELSEKISKWYIGFKLNLKLKIPKVLSRKISGKLLSNDIHQLDLYITPYIQKDVITKFPRKK